MTYQNNEVVYPIVVIAMTKLLLVWVIYPTGMEYFHPFRWG